MCERCTCWPPNQPKGTVTPQKKRPGCQAPTPPLPVHWTLFPLLFPLVGRPTGTPLPPCERVAWSSDSPPINRYSTLSCAFTLPCVYLMYPCCPPSLWLFGSKPSKCTAVLFWSMPWESRRFGWCGCAAFFFQCLFYSSVPPLDLSLAAALLSQYEWSFWFWSLLLWLLLCHIYCSTTHITSQMRKPILKNRGHFPLDAGYSNPQSLKSCCFRGLLR